MELYQFTAGAAVLLLVLEMLLPSFFFAGLAVGAACLAVVHFITGEFVIVRDLTVFAVSATIAFFVIRAACLKLDAKKSDINRY